MSSPKRERVLIVCPGRGSYTRESLGSLRSRSADANFVLDTCDELRTSLKRPTLRELDAEPHFRAALHLAGEHASLLTFGASLADLAQLDRDRYEVVGVCGNSLGFYTALAASGALGLAEAARLVETMGAYQAKQVLGGQLLYPLVDEHWRPDPARFAAVEAALAAAHAAGGRAYWSIDLASTAVIGGDDVGLRAFEAAIPAIVVHKKTGGERRFPMRLPMHSAFHTPLMQGTSLRAREELGDLDMRAPEVPLIDGRGYVHRPGWADPLALREYTLGHQVVAPYDFAASLSSALSHCAPDKVVCLGPGNAMGGPVAARMVQLGWAGLHTRARFEAAERERPALAAFGVPEQAAMLRSSA